MLPKGFIEVHFPGDNVPVNVRAASIVAYHYVDQGTCLFLSSGKAFTCLETPDEIAEYINQVLEKGEE